MSLLFGHNFETIWQTSLQPNLCNYSNVLNMMKNLILLIVAFPEEENPERKISEIFAFDIGTEGLLAELW